MQPGQPRPATRKPIEVTRSPPRKWDQTPQRHLRCVPGSHDQRGQRAGHRLRDPPPERPRRTCRWVRTRTFSRPPACRRWSTSIASRPGEAQSEYAIEKGDHAPKGREQRALGNQLFASPLTPNGELDPPGSRGDSPAVPTFRSTPLAFLLLGLVVGQFRVMNSSRLVMIRRVATQAAASIGSL